MSPKQTLVNIQNGFLFFKPEKKTIAYGFIFNYEKEKVKISLELERTFIEIHNYNYAKYRLNRTSFSINNAPPEEAFYEITNEMTKAMYPIEFTINQNLECLTIDNHKAIIERCEAVEQKIENYHNGAVSKKMIDNFRENYTNVASLISHLTNDLTYKILFFPLYKSYVGSLQTRMDFSMTVNDKVLHFDLNLQIEKYYTNQNKLLVQVASTHKNQPQSFKASYHLHPERNTLDMATGALCYPEETGFETVHFECYELTP
jgi:hypothetical protein